MTDTRLSVAEWLADHGALRSAQSVLGDARGAKANRLRTAASTQPVAPGFYALVTHDGTEGAPRGLMLPLQPVLGSSRAIDSDFHDAIETSLALCRQVLSAPRLPSLRFEFEEWFSIFGPSIGLPSILAFLGYFADVSPNSKVIAATGALDRSGRVFAVGALKEKVSAALRERCDCDVLIPAQDSDLIGELMAENSLSNVRIRAVSTFYEAVEWVFGSRTLTPLTSLLSVDEIIAKARAESSASKGAELLESVRVEQLPTADRARVWLELGTLYRHAGHTNRSLELHENARALLQNEKRVVGAESAERFELEWWLSCMDAFELDESVSALQNRLTEPFLSLRNELRCRGMLAQSLGMLGRYEEAVSTRSENLALHGLTAELSSTIAGTLCPLTLDCARAQRRDLFEQYAEKLLVHSASADETQQRFTASAIVRGLVLLGEPERALQWAFEQEKIFGFKAPAVLLRLVRSEQTIASHPELSTTRAICRALVLSGRRNIAETLVARVQPPTEHSIDLVAWLAVLAKIELVSGDLDLPDTQSHQKLSDLLHEQQQRHPAASRFYAALRAASNSKTLRTAIDSVWY